MAKKVAVLAVNPVNGSGLFQYLESFYENDIPYKVFAVADSKEISTNSGINMTVNGTVSELAGQSDSYDALVFACGDAVPQLGDNMEKGYNQDMMKVIKEFADKGKTLIGHCAAGMLFDMAGAVDGKNISLHPLAKPAVQRCNANDEKYTVDGNIYTAQSENTIDGMMDKVVAALSEA